MPSDRSKKQRDAKKQATKEKQKPLAAAAAAAQPANRDPATCQVSFPPCLSARQRALLHEIAEQRGLGHASRGEGEQRCIVLGNLQDAAEQITVPAAGKDLLTDEQIAQVLQQHFGIETTAYLAAAQQQPANSSSTRKGTASNSKDKPKASAAQANGPSTSKQYESVDAFVSQMGKLLELEKQAEVEAALEATTLCSTETAQARGRTLLNIRVSDAESGLLGRTLLTLVPNKGFGTTPAVPLPAHKFSPHDVVALKAANAGLGGPPLCSGLVYRVRETSIVVAVDEPPEEGLEQPLRLEKLANEVTYKRLQETLQHLSGPGTDSRAEQLPGFTLVDVLFGSREPRFAAKVPAWKAVNSQLDASQRAAVELALKAQDIALIHGPPGTGKTTAVVEVILQEVERGSRVLAAAASNIAVDNLVERLAIAAPKMKLVRYGHPARLLPQVLDKSLEAQVLRSDNSSLARDCRRDMQQLNRQLIKLESWKRAERRQIRAELRQLAKEERQRQQKALQEVLDGAQVLCCTLTGALHPQLQGQVFDVVVIDEAAQALEVACWSALLKGRRAVLAGDHLQLPPTVLSDTAAKAGLSNTLFERLQHSLGAQASSMLTVQYRMHAAIMDWSSNELYQGLIEAHESVAGHTLADLPTTMSNPAAAELPTLLLIDTAGCDFEEQQEQDGDSKYNRGEAEAALAHMQRLLAAGLSPADIGIITPYSAQVLQGQLEALLSPPH
eukprot:GHUV01012521.1.p1 GENE.GHUV01012521.1~~GHUV01012521.1.p1  ORF type:complete len:728 (+),score=288.54 GHUV01012521.1:305-2488(+)